MINKSFPERIIKKALQDIRNYQTRRLFDTFQWRTGEWNGF